MLWKLFWWYIMTSSSTQSRVKSILFTPSNIVKHNENNYHYIINITKLSTWCCSWVLRHFWISWVISVASDIEREKSDKFCSEDLISAWGSFTCRKCTTRDPRLYFPSEGSHTQDFLRSEKINQSRPGSNPGTSDPEASMITTGPPGSTYLPVPYTLKVYMY